MSIKKRKRKRKRKERKYKINNKVSFRAAPGDIADTMQQASSDLNKIYDNFHKIIRELEGQEYWRFVSLRPPTSCSPPLLSPPPLPLPSLFPSSPYLPSLLTFIMQISKSIQPRHAGVRGGSDVPAVPEGWLPPHRRSYLYHDLSG